MSFNQKVRTFIVYQSSIIQVAICPVDRVVECVAREDYDQLLSLLHEVSTDADPAGTVREKVMLQDKVEGAGERKWKN